MITENCRIFGKIHSTVRIYAEYAQDFSALVLPSLNALYSLSPGSPTISRLVSCFHCPLYCQFGHPCCLFVIFPRLFLRLSCPPCSDVSSFFNARFSMVTSFSSSQITERVSDCYHFDFLIVACICFLF